MPPIDSPAILVARFLKSDGYDDTLDAFLREANLPPSAATSAPGALSLEKVLEEKMQFDAALRYEKVGGGDERKGWSLPAPSIPKSIEDQLESPSNILCVAIDGFKTTEPGSSGDLLLVSSADRNIYCFDIQPANFILATILDDHRGPVLSFSPWWSSFLSTDMAGETVQYAGIPIPSLTAAVRTKDHSKYVVHSATYMRRDADQQYPSWLATAGWDKKVNVYCQSERTKPLLERRVATLDFPTNPESVLFTENPDTGQVTLVVSRQDSTHLYFYEVSGLAGAEDSYTCEEIGKQNLAPHSNAWVAFTPSCLALCPTDKTLVAVATNHTPHMKLIIVRLLFPQLTAETNAAQLTQASQARQALALQDREDAAILVHVSTLAPQTPYSTPQVCWRPDGTGVWVNGDDGFVRGVEAVSGKVVVTLRDGHEAGSKVRTICAGNVADEEGNEREFLVSGGFDKRLIVWRVKDVDSQGGDE